MANVEIYTKETCPYCHRAKALLSSKGVSFQELPIDGNAAKREEMRVFYTCQNKTTPK